MYSKEVTFKLPNLPEYIPMTGNKLRCNRCGNVWNYSGINKYVTSCSKCKTRNNMALDDRGSEHTSEFSWICRQCITRTTFFGGSCNCHWPNQNEMKMRKKQSKKSQ